MRLMDLVIFVLIICLVYNYSNIANRIETEIKQQISINSRSASLARTQWLKFSGNGSNTTRQQH